MSRKLQEPLDQVISHVIPHVIPHRNQGWRQLSKCQAMKEVKINSWDISFCHM